MPRSRELFPIPEGSLTHYRELFLFYVDAFGQLIASGEEFDADTRLGPLPGYWSGVVQSLEQSRHGLSSQAYYQAMEFVLHPSPEPEPAPPGPPDGLEQGELWDL